MARGRIKTTGPCQTCGSLSTYVNGRRSLYDSTLLTSAYPQLDVQLDLLHLSDRLEWDLASPLTPELFAAQYILDLSLPPSCAPLIAHAIHEELLRCKRECLEHGLVGTTSASTARDVEGVNKRAPKRMEGIWREWGEATAYGPRVSELTPAEIEENEIERERAVKCVDSL